MTFRVKEADSEHAREVGLDGRLNHCLQRIVRPAILGGGQLPIEECSQEPSFPLRKLIP